MAHNAEPETVAAYRPIPPRQRLVGSTRDDHPVGQRRRGAPSNFGLDLRIVGLPRGEQATLGPGRSGEDSQQSRQCVEASTGGLAGGQDPCRRSGVRGVELDDGRVEQSPFSIHGSRRQGGRLLQRPSRSTQVAGGGAGQGGRFELAGQRLLGSHRRGDAVGQSSATGDEVSSTRMQRLGGSWD